MTRRNAIRNADFLPPKKSLDRLVETEDDGTTTTLGYVITDGPDLFALDIHTLRSMHTYPGFNKGRSILRTSFPIVEVAKAMSARHDDDLVHNRKDTEFQQEEIDVLLESFVLPTDEEDCEMMRTWPKQAEYQHPKPLDDGA
jgi:hypothetical protein